MSPLDIQRLVNYMTVRSAMLALLKQGYIDEHILALFRGPVRYLWPAGPGAFN